MDMDTRWAAARGRQDAQGWIGDAHQIAGTPRELRSVLREALSGATPAEILVQGEGDQAAAKLLGVELADLPEALPVYSWAYLSRVRREIETLTGAR